MTYKLRLLQLCHEDFTDIRRPMTTDEARTHTDAILDLLATPNGAYQPMVDSDSRTGGMEEKHTTCITLWRRKACEGLISHP